jgi:heme exporter protein C
MTMFTWIIGVWIAAGIVIAFAMPAAQELRATPVAFFHIPMAVTTIVAFMLAAWHGAAWLRGRHLRSDAMSLAYAEVGAICGLIATTTGAIWARANWGSYWSWDPQQIGIVATLLTYGALFALRSAVEDEDKQRNLWAVYALFGALAAVFWTMIFRRLLPSLHPDHTILKSSALFRFALWFNIAGYVMVVVRLAGLRARLETARQYLKDSQWA